MKGKSQPFPNVAQCSK